MAAAHAYRALGLIAKDAELFEAGPYHLCGLSEIEFTKANEVARSQSIALEVRREELSLWLEEQRTRVSTAERLPGAITSFLADFEGLDVRHQKAQLQAILKSAYV